jgi:hypothetical protein
VTWIGDLLRRIRGLGRDEIPIEEGPAFEDEPTPVTAELPLTPARRPPLSAGMASEHFSWGELGCSDGAVVPTDLRPGALELVGYLETIREASGGRPMRVKVYRSPRWNDHVGGAEKSQHLLARAADIRIAGIAPQILHATILRLIAKGEIPEGGVGLYLPRAALEARPATATRKARPARAARVVGWVHYDCRGVRARWNG